MKYRVEFAKGVKEKIVEYHKADPAGVDEIFDTVNALAVNPRPREARPYGKEGEYRIRIGRYRLMYRVRDDVVTITVFHIGRA